MALTSKNNTTCEDKNFSTVLCLLLLLFRGQERNTSALFRSYLPTEASRSCFPLWRIFLLYDVVSNVSRRDFVLRALWLKFTNLQISKKLKESIMKNLKLQLQVHSKWVESNSSREDFLKNLCACHFKARAVWKGCSRIHSPASNWVSNRTTHACQR